jgi:ubiquinone/menaquinone biosynthesis C-methylase UbiE
MDHGEMVALLREGVPTAGGTWADLGAGSGSFTWALHELIGPAGTIIAVDCDSKALERLRAASADRRDADIRPVEADFMQPLDLPPLDGVLMANALHFVADQRAVLSRIAGYLRARGRLLLVEYETGRLPWTPYPVPFARFTRLAGEAGLASPVLIGTRRSPTSGVVMYSALAENC